MKKLFFLIGLMWCIKANGQVKKEAEFLGKNEISILEGMRHDSVYHYQSLNKETDTSYHLTYIAKEPPSFCNFFIENDKCTAVVFYYPKEFLPEIITSLNGYYKRTDKTTWVDNSLEYMVNLFLDNTDTVKIGFKKM